MEHVGLVWSRITGEEYAGECFNPILRAKRDKSFSDVAIQQWWMTFSDVGDAEGAAAYE